ncbi:MAG: glycoside hydrolase family 5 protein [Chlorobi bacterium]|nr:glycoside hydrolase family 5 protein [Chlorobiota bacterium]
MKNKTVKISGVLVLIATIIYIYINYRTTYSEDPDRPFIHAEDGRIMILHGFNVLSSGKSHPLRVGHLQKDDFLRLTENWGFNAVRLLIFWDGIEPEKGKYDYKYIARIKERLDWCEEAGLKVILDMHQDLYSVRFGGDCAPEWAVIDDNKPFEMQNPWEMNYFQPAVKAALTNFWNPEKGHPELRDHFISAMAEAVKYLGNHKAVIGIDIFNEPTLATPDGFFNLEEKFLTPFYQKAIDKIRTINNNIWIFFEPTAFGPNQGFYSDLEKLTDPRKGEQRLVYYPHLYTPDLDINGKYMENTFFIDLWAHSRQVEYKKYNTPMLIGEFGLGGNDKTALSFVEEVMQMSDKITGGWFYWDYDGQNWGIWDYKNKKSFPKAKVLDRPYPRMIAGYKPKFSFNPETKIFTLEMEWNNNIKPKLTNNITEIYIPVHTWPSGWKVLITEGKADWHYKDITRCLYITPRTEGKIKITVEPK